MLMVRFGFRASGLGFRACQQGVRAPANPSYGELGLVLGARALSGRVPTPDHPDLSALGFRFSPKGTFAQRSRFSWWGLWERLCVHALTGACARAAARGAGVRRDARTCLRASASQETASIAGSGARSAGGDRIHIINYSHTVLSFRACCVLLRPC